MDVSTFATNPAAFRDALVIPSAHGPARFGDCMAPFQARDFAAMDLAFQAVQRGAKPSPRFLFFERTKKSGKDHDIAVQLSWLLAFTQRPLDIVLAAGDQVQAEEPRKRFDKLLGLNPFLKAVLRSDRFRIANVKTGSTVSIVTSDPRTTPGQLPDVLVANELTAMSEQFYDEVFENALGNPSALVVVLTNSGHLDTWQHERRQRAIESDLWHFSAYSRPAPWHSEAELAERRKDIAPQRYARLWEGQWQHEAGDALDPEIIERAVDPSAAPHETARPGHVYVAGVDLAVSRHHSAIVALARNTGWTEMTMTPSRRLHGTQAALQDLGFIDTPPPEYSHVQHPGDGKLHLAHVRSWRPPSGGMVDYDDIENHIVEMHRRLRFSCVLFDRHQEHYLVARLRKRGVPADVFNNSSGTEQQAQALALLTGFQESRFALFDEPDLIADLRLTQIVDKSAYVRLEWPQSAERGHCDRAAAFALASLAAGRRRPAARVIPRAIVMDDSWVESGDAGYESAAVDEQAAVRETLEWLSSR